MLEHDNVYEKKWLKEIPIVVKQKIVTNVEKAISQNINVFTQGHVFTIENAENQTVYVLDVTGRIILKTTCSSPCFTITLPRAGIYLVKIGESSTKVVVH